MLAAAHDAQDREFRTWLDPEIRQQLDEADRFFREFHEAQHRLHVSQSQQEMRQALDDFERLARRVHVFAPVLLTARQLRAEWLTRYALPVTWP